jgi:hypothetical protein
MVSGFWLSLRRENSTIGPWLLEEYLVLPGCGEFGCFARCRRGTNGLKGDCAVVSALSARLAVGFARAHHDLIADFHEFGGDSVTDHAGAEDCDFHNF